LARIVTAVKWQGAGSCGRFAQHLLAAIGREAGLTDEDVASVQRLRDPTPAAPTTFE
jgi:hypothetical protein